MQNVHLEDWVGSGRVTIYIYLGVLCCEGGRCWSQDHVRWQALVLAVLNLQVLLPEHVNCQWKRPLGD